MKNNKTTSFMKDSQGFNLKRHQTTAVFHNIKIGE
jgi:hypothetical protein